MQGFDFEFKGDIPFLSVLMQGSQCLKGGTR